MHTKFFLTIGAMLAGVGTAQAQAVETTGIAAATPFADQGSYVTSADGVVTDSVGRVVWPDAATDFDKADRARLSHLDRFEDEEVDTSFDGDGDD